MAALTYAEKQQLEDYLQLKEGWLLDFNNKDLYEFVYKEVQCDLGSYQYEKYGTSKAKRMRAFWEVESDVIVGMLLESFVGYYKERRPFNPGVFSATIEMDEYVYKIANRLKSSIVNSNVHVIRSLNDDDLTFVELAESIRNMILASKPSQALDRMHTFYMKYLRGLCKKHQISYTDAESLNAVFGKYIKYIERLAVLDSEMTLAIIKYSINLLDKFNTVRNNQSFAHDNELLNHKESLYIFDTLARLKDFIDGIEERVRLHLLKKQAIGDNDTYNLPF